MRKVVLFVFVLMTGLSAQTRNLTLRESLEIGMKNSKDLKISHSKVLGSDAKITEVRSRFFPQIKFGASYTRLSNIPPFEVSLPIFPAPIQISPVILNNYNLRLSLQQPIFTGLKLWSYKSAAENNNKADKLDFSKEKNEVAYKIESAFWNYYKAEEMQKLVGENMNQIKQHLEDTKHFLANGLVTQNDVLKLEVEYSNARLRKIDAVNNVEIAGLAFNQALGLPLDDSTGIITGKLEASMISSKPTNLITEAKDNRPELKSLEMRVRASQNVVTAAKGNWFPSVYLTGNYYYSRPNQRIIPAVDKFKDTWDVGVALSWDILTWGGRSSKVTEAEQTKVQAETSLSQLKDAVEIEVYQSYLNLKRTYQRVEVSELSVKQSEENYRMIKEKYNSQVASSTDLIDAETTLLEAKTNYNNALVDYELAKAKLDKAVGKKIY